MKILIILFAIQTCLAFAEEIPEWVQKVRLSQKEGKESKGVEELKNLSGVKASIMENLKVSSSYLNDAIDASMIIGDKDFVRPLLKVVESDQLEILQQAKTISTINQLSRGDQIKSVLDSYQRLCPFNKSSSAVLKVACLGIYNRFPGELKGSDLSTLIEDESFEVRLEAVNKVSLIKDANQKIEILKKSLTSSPYQLRLRSLDEIRKLPEHIKEKLKPELEKCKSDGNDAVKKACRRL